MTSKQIKIYLVIAAVLIALTKTADAHATEKYVCNGQCEQLRILSLSNPYLAGEDVSILQKELHSLGFFKGLCNGVFTPETHVAVINFQRNAGLKVDGKVEESTWDAMAKKLDSSVAVKKVPPPKGEKTILIDTVHRTLTVLNDGEPYKKYPVALGKYHTPTPIGNWKISRKAMNWGTGFGTRWMGLNVGWGVYGIHGTNKPYSIGGYQSHGCIRMHNRHVEQIYPWVSAGTPVIIVGNPFKYMDPSFKMMRKGDRGAAVMEVQKALKRLGYEIDVDGIWGPGMEKVIIQYRKDIGLPFDNAVDSKVYQSLGFK